MEVGFLSVNKRSVVLREAQMALFDGGHTCGPLITVPDIKNIEWGLTQLRAVCDAIVIEGATDEFYEAFKDRLATQPENFELDGKLYSVTEAATADYLNNKLVPLINSKNKKARYRVVVFKTFGKTEEELKVILKDYFKARSKVQIGLFPDYMECEVHARASASMSQVDLNSAMKEINKLLYKFTYALERVSIAERVGQMLKEQGLKIKIAESFTGGAIAKALTSVSGASEFLVEDLVTYSVLSKIKRLGVPAESIAENGVVSRDTVYRMVAGLISSGDCDIALATTGNAGPTAVSGPVGLCFIAIGNKNEVHNVKYMFDGDREDNIRRGVKNALFLLYNYLNIRETVEENRQAAPTEEENNQ